MVYYLDTVELYTKNLKEKLLCRVTLMFKIIFGEQGCVIIVIIIALNSVKCWQA